MSDPTWRIEKRRKSDGGLEWEQDTNPVGSYNWINAIVADNTYLYIAAGQLVYISPKNTQWRIEKRRKSDGGLEWTKAVDPNPVNNAYETPNGIAIDNDYVYVVGGDSAAEGGIYQWRIEKRRKSDGGLESGWPVLFNPSTLSDYPYAVAVDNTYLYVVGLQGVAYPPTVTAWRIEKRNKSNGALIWAKTVHPSSGMDWANAIAIDGSSLYVTGYVNALGNSQWCIEKRRKSDGELESGWPVLSDLSTNIDGARGIAADSNSIYIVGYDSTPAGLQAQWRIEKRDKGGFIDIGLRVWRVWGGSAQAIAIAAEPADPPTSAVRIAKEGKIYGLALINVTTPPDAMDSGVRIQTSSGIKALRKY